jgi:outer membrane protein assembly factor BamB
MPLRAFCPLVLLVACSSGPAQPVQRAPAAPPLAEAASQVFVPIEPSSAPVALLATPPRTAAPGALLTPTSEQLRAPGATPRLTARKALPLKKKWATKVGKTTFRSTMAWASGSLVIGTHGATLAGSNEPSDGVYVLEPSKGKVTRFIPTPGKGDKDVGGVAFDGKSVLFSTDNGQVVKADLASGAIQWSTPVAGKARPAPALANLDGKGALDVVVGDEAGDLHALDGDSGQHLWLKSTGANEYDARGFVAAAAIEDLNDDRIDDVIAGARDGALVAYEGRTGGELWREVDGSGIHASPSLLDLDGDGRLEVLGAWSYSRLAVLDAPTGSLRYEQRLEQDSAGIEGLFGSPVPMPAPAGAGFIVQGTSWWGGHHLGAKAGDAVDGVVLATQRRRAFRSNEGRVTASAVVMDLGDDGIWDAVLGTEDRDLLAVGGDGSRRLLARLGGAVEATAAVGDVDGDGNFELLVAANDGMLTCFETGSRTRPLISRFRGETSDNRGHFGAVALRFEPAP